MHAFRKIFVGLIFLVVATDASAKEMPLWEGLQKNARMMEADKKLIESVRQSTNGDLKAGAKRAIELGWQSFETRDFETAIRRFNQAWLLDPENPAIYWGFALVTHQRGEPLETVERWFAETEKRIPNVVPLLSDHGRILEEQNEDKRAVEYFNRALAIDPDYVEAHVGMARIAQKAGDLAGYELHMKAIAKARKKT
ncbi:tetratricopeptide repeat protein [Mesorhizobium sp. NPDC059054]|uniref:tetratricopeptide repeat protein n=1 Tax=Mesorhizobium sp. NPDC059054 TaxID=3346711 RepID=UPI0036B21413